MDYGGWVSASDEEACRAAMCIPAEETPVILLPLGVPEIETHLRECGPLEEVVTFLGDVSEASNEPAAAKEAL